MLIPERSSGSRTVWPLVLVLVCAGGCALESGRPPVARGQASPVAILENDGFQTEVNLDASASADPIDDPEGERPLSYEWLIIGDEYRFVDGNETSVMPQVTLRGSRPATIELTVTDEDGLSSSVRFQMQLTVRP